MVQEPGTYWHMLPTATQARKVVWNAIDSEGRRLIDQAFPEQIVKRRNENEMMIELMPLVAGRAGSIWQAVGSDNYDALVGSNPKGIVFSEYSVSDPAAWDYIRPILTENGGWAIFIYTPRGKNHGHSLYRMARSNPEWFCELLTIRETGVLTEAQVDAERAAGMSRQMVEQEFYCSFESELEGSYYAEEMARARGEGRITRVPYDGSAPVETAWDIGVGDECAIWFFQRIGKEIHLIDYYENSGEGVGHYAKVLSSKPYVYSTHWAPHDAKGREFGTGVSKFATARRHGIKWSILPKLGVDDGIEAVRGLLGLCWFDEAKCGVGIEALKSYRKMYNRTMRVWSMTPVHDWASNGADAFRYLAIAVRKGQGGWKPLIYPKTGIV